MNVGELEASSRAQLTSQLLPLPLPLTLALEKRTAPLLNRINTSQWGPIISTLTNLSPSSFAMEALYSCIQLVVEICLHERIQPKLIGPVDELETMSKQQGMKEILELETFTNQDPSTSYHIFQEVGTPWPYFVSLQGDNNILGPLFRDTQCLMDLREKDLLQS